MLTLVELSDGLGQGLRTLREAEVDVQEVEEGDSAAAEDEIDDSEAALVSVALVDEADGVVLGGRMRRSPFNVFDLKEVREMRLTKSLLFVFFALEADDCASVN